MLEPAQSNLTGVSVIQGKLELILGLAKGLVEATDKHRNAEGHVNWMAVAQEVHTDLNANVAILEAELTTLIAAGQGGIS